MIQGHGDDVFKYPGKIKANFSSNVFPEGADDQLLKAIQDNLNIITNYPDPEGETFRQLLAESYGMTPNSFIITNGAVESIYLIAQTFKETSAAIFIPTFSEYEDASTLHNLSCQFLNIQDIHENTKLSASLAFLCNPNNPTGHLFDTQALLKLIHRNPHTTFVIDEAYADFVNTPQRMSPYIAECPNLLVIHSMTKLFSIPGLRIGYLMGNPSLITRIRKYKMPWSVNSMALLAGETILRHYKSIKPSVEPYIIERGWLADRINGMEGLEAINSSTTFLLVKLLKGESHQLKSYLIEHYGCLIRDASNFRGLDPHYIRIAALDRQKNELLINGLKAWSGIIH